MYHIFYFPLTNGGLSPSSGGGDRLVICTIMVAISGVPDEPQSCTVHNTTETYVTLACIPGYDGGDVMVYHVDTQYEGTSRKSSSRTTEMVNQTFVYIRVKDMYPGTEYTGFIYTENMYGRSEKEFQLSFKTGGSECCQF
jgi:hypothetical protein